MKNFNLILVKIFYLIFHFSTLTFGQYIPVKEDQNAFYLCESYRPNYDKYLVRSELDTFYYADNKEIYVPYRTLTDGSDNWPCYKVLTNNWLGDSIVYQLDSGFFSFHYTPVDHDFYLTTSRKFNLPINAEIGDKFEIDSNIEAEVKSISQIVWEGEDLNILTYTLTHDGSNPNFKWLTGEIRISDKYNIFNFPNLQYFPYEWRNCALAGVANPKLGMQDLPNREIYRMDAGDEFTTKESYDLNVGEFFQFVRKLCLEVIEEDNDYQKRILQVEILNRDPETKLWKYSIDTIQELLIFEELPLSGKADDLSDYGGNRRQIFIHENGKKYKTFYYDIGESPFGINCFKPEIEDCFYQFGFKDGFARYIDCQSFMGGHLYIPLHRINDGIIYGAPFSFDSFLLAEYYPVRPYNACLFLCTHSNDTEENEFLSSEFESIKKTSEAHTYIPKKSLTSLYNSYEGANTSWMGDSVKIDFDVQQFKFNYRPVKFDQNLNSNVTTPQRSFSLPFVLTLGTQFMIDPNISAKVVSDTSITWQGSKLLALTIRLTHDGTNPDYNWTTGNIVITQKYGIHEFPNLQYFPYEWNSCVLAGTKFLPKIGVQDLSTVDIYRMGQGDQYTTERFNQVIEHYFQIKKCLSIISENVNKQERIVEIKKYNQSYVDYTWSLQQDTIIETIVYDEQTGALQAGELRKDIGKYCRMDVPDTKKIYDVYDNGTDSVIYHRPIDDCGPTIVLKHGFDDYFDFSFTCASGPWSNYYLMRHSIFGGITTGTPLNVDSLLYNRKIIQLDVSVFPNPSTGNFIVEVPQTLALQEFYLIDIKGKRNKVRAVRSSDGLFNIESNSRNGIYMLQAVSREGNIYSLGKVVLIN